MLIVYLYVILGYKALPFKYIKNGWISTVSYSLATYIMYKPIYKLDKSS